MRKSGRNYLSDVRQPMTLLIVCHGSGPLGVKTGWSLVHVVNWTGTASRCGIATSPTEDESNLTVTRRPINARIYQRWGRHCLRPVRGTAWWAYAAEGDYSGGRAGPEQPVQCVAAGPHTHRLPAVVSTGKHRRRRMQEEQDLATAQGSSSAPDSSIFGAYLGACSFVGKLEKLRHACVAEHPHNLADRSLKLGCEFF